MEELMNRTRAKYEKKRNKFSFIDRVFFNKLRKPKWAKDKGDSRFDIVYRDQDLLYSEGKIVLAHVFKANSHLYKYGEYDSPAAVVFSEDSYFEENFYELDKIVCHLVDLVERDYDDSEFRNLARILADERSAQFNIFLPQDISNGRKVYFTTIMVHRKLLPSNYLKSNWFPLLICPSKTKASIILPYYCWDSDLAVMWEMKELPKQKFKETDQI